MATLLREFGGFPQDISNLAFIGRSLGILNGVTADVSFNDSPRSSLFGGKMKKIEQLPEGEKHILVFDSSFAKGESIDIFMEDLLSLPKSLRDRFIILIKQSSRGSDHGGGHIETMCLELGVPCIFYGETPSETLDDDLYARTSISEDKKFKVYSDGYEARIYQM